MTAQLVAITFDNATEDYLRREMSRNEADQMALEQMGDIGNLTDNPVLLNNLPAGHYMLVVSAELDKDTVTKLHLLKTDTKEVIHTSVLELTPLMRSAVENGPEFTALVSTLLDYDEEDEEDFKEREEAERQSNLITLSRAACLEGALSPYVENDAKFNVELLDMLDFMTYPLITKGVNLDIDEDDISPMISVYGGNKLTLH